MISLHICCKDIFKSASPAAKLAEIYLKRIKQFGWKIETIFYKKSTDQLAALAKSAESAIILDASGKHFDSIHFSNLVEKKKRVLGKVDFFIGPSEGFPADVLKKNTQQLLSLSAMTFPHKIVVALLLEQIYRSATIVDGHPYNK